jgi:hypothetical protein
MSLAGGVSGTSAGGVAEGKIGNRLFKCSAEVC